MNRSIPLPSSVWFDSQYRAGNSELQSAIASFQNYIECQERELGTRSRKRTDDGKKNHRLSIQAIACNLIVTRLVKGDRFLAMPLDHNAMWGMGRYGSPVFGQHFLDAIALLEALNFIARQSTGFHLTRRKSAPSVFKPNWEKLSEYLPLADVRWDWIRRDPDVELIVLKTRKDKAGNPSLVDYQDGKTSKAFRRQIKRINEGLASAKLVLLEDDATETVNEEGVPIAPFQRNLRRTFNNGSWQAGGRLSGNCFWMTMPRDERFRRIRIGGEQIADVDYRQIYPRLAYVIAGAEPPAGDVYDIFGDGSCRDGWKVLINALLFADGRLKNWPEGTRGLLPPDLGLREAISLIEAKHAPIARLFGKELGYRLMRIESDVLINILTHLFKTGVTALPLHDAILVRRSDVDAAKAAMEYELELRTGHGRGSVEIDFGP